MSAFKNGVGYVLCFVCPFCFCDSISSWTVERAIIQRDQFIFIIFIHQFPLRLIMLLHFHFLRSVHCVYWESTSCCYTTTIGNQFKKTMILFKVKNIYMFPIYRYIL